MTLASGTGDYAARIARNEDHYGMLGGHVPANVLNEFKRNYFS
jgi:hypothetical protein